MSGILRTLARNKAKNKMKQKGLSKICKGDFFAKHWREFVKTSKPQQKAARGRHKFV